jgi:hypothetical protein
MWQAADRGRITIGFPALAVIVAGIALQASARDWDAMLWPATITALVEYPGQGFGDHLRRAHGDGWHATLADHHLYQLAAVDAPVRA